MKTKRRGFADYLKLPARKFAGVLALLAFMGQTQTVLAEKIILVAGTGKKGAGGIGGPPEQVELNQPHGVTVHRHGTLYITDSYNHRILKIER